MTNRELPSDVPGFRKTEAGYFVADRKCKCCNQAKPLSEFRQRPIRVTNRRITPEIDSFCLPCRRASERVRKAKNRHRYGPSNSPTKAGPKRRARVAVGQAVKSGKLKKPTHCEGCGAQMEKRKLHGHHRDYAARLDVVWLCPLCHAEEHRKESVRSRRVLADSRERVLETSGACSSGEVLESTKRPAMEDRFAGEPSSGRTEFCGGGGVDCDTQAPTTGASAEQLSIGTQTKQMHMQPVRLRPTTATQLVSASLPAEPIGSGSVGMAGVGRGKAGRW